MRIAIGNDHRGFRLKEAFVQRLESSGHVVTDFGCHDENAMDFTDVAIPLSQAVAASENDFGILICSNGVGMSVCANKVKGIRAALCHDTFAAGVARRHTNANVLCLGASCIGEGVALAILETFLSGTFEGGRHSRRLEKIKTLEDQWGDA